jgi:hypothetical protein
MASGMETERKKWKRDGKEKRHGKDGKEVKR